MAELVNNAIENGAEVVCGGGLKHEMGENFFAPTLLTGCTLDMRISHEEIFGPVVAVMKFKEDTDALALSNRFVCCSPCALIRRSVRRVLQAPGWFCSSECGPWN